MFVELEIPHIYHSVARNSPKRQELIDKWDVFQVPYIEVRITLKAVCAWTVFLVYEGVAGYLHVHILQGTWWTKTRS